VVTIAHWHAISCYKWAFAVVSFAALNWLPLWSVGGGGSSVQCCSPTSRQPFIHCTNQAVINLVMFNHCLYFLYRRVGWWLDKLAARGGRPCRCTFATPWLCGDNKGIFYSQEVTVHTNPGTARLL